MRGVFLQREPSPGITKEFEYYKQMMPGITLKEVNDVAAPLKQNDKIFVSLQGPESSNYQLPDNAGLLALAQNI